MNDTLTLFLALLPLVLIFMIGLPNAGVNRTRR